MKKLLFFTGSALMLFAAPVITNVSGISQKNNCCDKTITNVDGCCLRNNNLNTNSSCCTIIRLEAEGVGVPPCNGACSTALAKVMARRAAILDAYKALAEKMYGIRINGRDTVKNMMLQNSTLRSYVEGLIRGAQIEDEEFKDGIYKVTMSVRIDVKEWNNYLLHR